MNTKWEWEHVHRPAEKNLLVIFPNGGVNLHKDQESVDSHILYSCNLDPEDLAKYLVIDLETGTIQRLSVTISRFI